MQVRPGEERDLHQLNAIYNHYVRTAVCTFDIDPVSMEDRREWFAEFDGARYRLFVSVDGDDVTGFAYSGRFMTRKAYETSISTSVYVDDAARRGGVGTALYRSLFDAITGEDLHRAYAGITMPNAASVALHERFGFVRVAYFTEQGRKFGKYWDVAWFEKAL